MSFKTGKEKLIAIRENDIDSNGSSSTHFGLKYSIIDTITTPIDYIRSPIICAKAAYMF